MAAQKRPRGGVIVHRRPSGEIAYRARLTINGELRSLGLHPTPEAANRVIDAEIARLGGEKKLDGVTLIAWGSRWLDRRELDKLHRSIDSMRSVWNTRVATAPFANWPMKRIARTDIVRWLKAQLAAPPKRGHRHTSKRDPSRRTSRSTVVNSLNLLRSAPRDAADEGLIPSNPAEGVRVPKVPRTDETWTYLSADEIERLLGRFEATTDREREHWTMQRIVLTVAIYTGLREGELWGLRWCDVQLDGQPELVVRHSYRGPTKGGRVRRVPLLPRAFAALKEWRKIAGGIGAALVFPGRAAKGDDGLQGCHCKGYDAGLAGALERAGIKRSVRFHDLRHYADLRVMPRRALSAGFAEEDVKMHAA
jgi:integrase